MFLKSVRVRPGDRNGVYIGLGVWGFGLGLGFGVLGLGKRMLENRY